MKIYKLFGKRGFAVFTALALCVSLVTPSFAATFTDLQNAVNGSGGTDLGKGHYGYGSENAETGKYGIEAWNGEDGVRNVILNEETTADSGHAGIEIVVGQTVALDLNGHTIKGTVRWDAALVVRGGDLTLKDSSKDKTGKVTGGKHAGVWVEAGAVDSSGNYIPVREREGKEYTLEGGSFTMEGGTIEGNSSYAYTDGDTSSGVGVTGAGSTFTMNGGTIKNNNGNAPAVVVDGAKFEMTGGLIESNTAGNKDGVEIKDGSLFEMTGGSLRVDGGAVTVKDDGGSASVSITGGTFSQLDEKYLPEGHSLDKNGVLTHTWAGEVTTPATCTAEGKMTYTCTAAGCGVTKTEPIAKLDHTPADAVRENEVDATCTAEGSYDEVVYCSKCRETLSSTHKTIAKLEHAPAEAVREHVVDATCTEEGSYDAVVYCSKCGDKLSSTHKTIDKLEHNWDDGEVTTPATCAAEGEMTYTCSDCGETKTEPVAVDPDNHAGETELRDAKEATYEEDGYTGDTYCLGCDALLQKGEPIHLDPPEEPETPDEPVVEPDEPVVEPDEPVVEPDEPVVEPDEPVVEPEEPVVEPDEPVVEPDEPVVEPDEPVVEPDEPVVEPDEPVVEPDEPVAEPDVPVVEPDVPVVDTPVEPEVEIDDPAVPLASGPVTGGEFIDYLWRHEGEPGANVVGDDEYAPAISWARSIGIIPDDGFDPDELVTVGAVRSILSSLAVYNDMVMPELTTLTGDDDEAVLNCDEVLAEFFGEELTE